MVAFTNPLGVSTLRDVPISEVAIELIARAILRLRRGEYTAEVTFPTHWLPLCNGQKFVFGSFSGGQSIYNPTCLRFTPWLLICFNGQFANRHPHSPMNATTRLASLVGAGGAGAGTSAVCADAVPIVHPSRSASRQASQEG